jgi:parallel beta-helix repeat protein
MKKGLTVTMALCFPLVILVISLKVLAGTPARAAPPVVPLQQAPGDCEVTTITDGGPGSLRQCISDLQAGGTITFNTSVFPSVSPMTIVLNSALPDIITDNLTLDASNAGVVLDGSGLSSGDGLHITSDGNVIRGLQILYFPGSGISIDSGASHNLIGGSNALPGGSCTGDCNLISGNGVNGVRIEGSDTVSNTVSGNYIGTDVSGTAAIPNNCEGVRISAGAQYNVIGPDNLISGNSGVGIQIWDSDTMSNTVAGNLVGTDVSGMVALGNYLCGVVVGGGASYNVIGGTLSEDRNIVSGNQGGMPNPTCGAGIAVNYAFHNQIIGNYVGTDINGMVALGNAVHGVEFVDGAQGNVIDGNVISGNGWAGVQGRGSGTMSNTVSGNYIGTNATGTGDIGNTDAGIYLSSGDYTLIEGNIVANNSWGMLLLGVVSSTVRANQIGIDAIGTPAGNQDYGIYMGYYAHHNAIGGPTLADGNVIANNSTGVRVSGYGAYANTISHNSIYNNADKGIELWYDANDYMFPPIVTEVSDLTVEGIAVSDSTVEIFSDNEDEGRWFHGATIADSSGYFTFTTTFPFTGTNVTATATDADGNTSEFTSPYAPNRDVVAAAIYVPQQHQQIEVSLTPLVRVGNGGTVPETFAVTTVITHAGARVYEDQQTVVDLAVLHYRTLSFTRWTPTVLGDYTFEVTVHPMPPDDDPTNDRLTLDFSVVDDRVDLWSRDNPTDDGREPSVGSVWQSPDLWVRNTADGLTEHQDPINNITNTVYVRVRNRGTLTATDAMVSVYWHPPALVIGQSWWEAIGAASVGEVAPGAVHTVAMDWRPQITGVLTEPYHTCLIDVISSTQEPAPEQWDVRGSNNIEQRNVDIISPTTTTSLHAASSTSVSMTFSVGNPYAGEQLVDVIVDATGMPAGSEVRLDLGELFGRWQRFGQGSLTGATEVSGTTQVAMPGGDEAMIGGLPLAGEELIEVVLEVSGLNGRRGEIDVSERIGGDVLGGISLHLVGRIEIFLPVVMRDFSP